VEENNVELSYEQMRPEYGQPLATQVQFVREPEVQSSTIQDIQSTETQELEPSSTQHIRSLATQEIHSLAIQEKIRLLATEEIHSLPTQSTDTRQDVHTAFTQEIPISIQNAPLRSEHRVHLHEEVIQPIEEMPMDVAMQEVTEEIQDSEIVVDDTVEMSTEEIVVTDGMQAGEIMVGEEIEVQEIEIQSDGMTGNEIVLGEEVVMQYLPEERDGGLEVPMVPAHMNTEHSNMVLETENFGGEPRQMFSSVYTSDHSMMAADPLSKQTRSNSNDVYVEGTPESIYTIAQQPLQTVRADSRNDRDTGMSQDGSEGRNS